MTALDQLRRALDPASIALIGASENPNKVGGRPLLYLQRWGYRGRLYPINPNRSDVQGVKAYPDLASLPEAPDLAIIMVAGDGAVQAVEACARRGVRLAICMASGFGETGADGVKAEKAMVATARAHGMRLVGPNTQGLVNFGTGMVASFSTMFLEAPPADGPAAVVSQSGAMSAVAYGLLRARGIGVRHCHATGNDADVTAIEMARAVIEDDGVRLLLLYLEAIPDAAMLADLARRARERLVPIVALKTGRTAQGQRAAKSHTGALANEDRVVDAFFRQHGIWRARDMAGLVSAAEMYLKGWRPDGRRLVAISNSGASCVMAADLAAELGLPLAAFADGTRRALAAALPGFATTANPIDLTAALLSNNRLFGAILPIVADDPAADLFLIAIPVAGQGYDIDAFARDTAEFASRTGKPVAVAAPQALVADRFRAAGIPTFSGETEAVAALDQLARHWALLRQRPAPPMPQLGVNLPPGPGRFLNEAESLALLAAHALPVVPHRLCRSESEARIAFRDLGSPVAVKACSADVPHKSELGLVALNLVSEEAVVRAFGAQMATLERIGAAPDGIIIAAMQEGLRELVLGAKLDPVFGPVVMIGDGGKYVEALPDIELLLPPFTEAEARDTILRLRIAPILKGVRGEKAADIDALAHIAWRLGALIASAKGKIASLDINPVLIGAAGQGVTILDALVERAGGS
ncbi:MAG TPA: acetate--CoA ligase family protein [Stellaceae bacterium]|nr:acetate--CoA ligase family protein [Stellaceae bacterium]